MWPHLGRGYLIAKHTTHTIMGQPIMMFNMGPLSTLYVEYIRPFNGKLFGFAGLALVYLCDTLNDFLVCHLLLVALNVGIFAESYATGIILYFPPFHWAIVTYLLRQVLGTEEKCPGRAGCAQNRRDQDGTPDVSPGRGQHAGIRLKI